MSLGANIDPIPNLKLAIDALAKHSVVIAQSSFWTNPPLGIDGPDFVNCALHVQSNLTMHDFKRDILRKIERDLGRKRSQDKFAPRPIDIDILIFNQIEVDVDIWRYAYLAIPLAEIHPLYIDSRNNHKLTDTANFLKIDSEIYSVK